MRSAIYTALTIFAVVSAFVIPGTAGTDTEESDGKVLVEVNGDRITRERLERYASFLRSAQERAPATAAERSVMEEESRRAALEYLVQRQLLVQAAQDEFFGQRNVEDVLSRIDKQEMRQFEENIGSPVRMHSFLRSRGLSRDEFTRLRRETMLIQAFLQKKVEEKVYVPPWKIRRYYREHRDEFRHPHTVAFFRQLWVNATGSNPRKKAERLLEKIRSGGDFARVANEQGAGTFEDPGGLLSRRKSQLRGWLKEVLTSLEPGEVSDVQETQEGYCIVKLEKWQKPGVRSFEEVADTIRRTLRGRVRQRIRRRLIKKLRKEATIKYRPAARALLQKDTPR